MNNADERNMRRKAGERSNVSAARNSRSWDRRADVALLMAATRNVALEDRAMREGHWQVVFAHTLEGRTLGNFLARSV